MTNYGNVYQDGMHNHTFSEVVEFLRDAVWDMALVMNELHDAKTKYETWRVQVNNFVDTQGGENRDLIRQNKLLTENNERLIVENATILSNAVFDQNAIASWKERLKDSDNKFEVLEKVYLDLKKEYDKLEKKNANQKETIESQREERRVSKRVLILGESPSDYWHRQYENEKEVVAEMAKDFNTLLETNSGLRQQLKMQINSGYGRYEALEIAFNKLQEINQALARSINEKEITRFSGTDNKAVVMFANGMKMEIWKNAD